MEGPKWLKPSSFTTSWCAPLKISVHQTLHVCNPYATASGSVLRTKYGVLGTDDGFVIYAIVGPFRLSQQWSETSSLL